MITFLVPVGRLVEVFADVGHTSGYGEPLSERAGAHIYEVQAGGGVALQVGVQLAEVLQLLNREESCLSPRCVQDGGCVTLTNDI